MNLLRPDAAPVPGMPAAVPVAAPARRAWLLPAVLLGSVAGAALQVLQAALWPPAVYGALLLVGAISGAGLWLGGTRTPPGARAGAALLAAMVLVFALCGVRAGLFAAQALEPGLEGRDIEVVGVVAAMPQPVETGLRLRLAVESARLEGAAVQLPALIDLGWYGTDWGRADGAALPALRAGERWRMVVRLKAPHGARNPHGFDYELWLWGQGVQATGTVRAAVRGTAAPQRLAGTWQYPVEQLRQSVRDAILERLAPDASDARSARTAGVVAALVTGDQRAIERADWDVFRATGVAHLMSISGLHITLFAWLAAALVQWLWRRSQRLCLAWPAPSAALVCGVLLAAAYALFSGWGVPAQRTIAMLATVLVLRLYGRSWPWLQRWLLACAVVVVPDPWALWQPGFWLSFVAVGILFASNSIAFGAYQTDVRGRFYALLREQWVVALALTPLGVLLFGQVSLVGLVANLLAIPWVTLVVTPLAFLGVLWAPLWQVAGWGVQLLGVVLQWLAAWPMAMLWVPAAPLWAGLVGVVGGALLALRLPWQVRVLGLPLLLPVLLWQPPRPAPGHFELLAADVGQGNAVLVRTATHTLLYDTGPRYSQSTDAGERVLVPLLRALGERVDVLMLSHRDSDHTGGAAAVLAAQPQATLTGSIEGEHALQALRPVRPCRAGQRWRWDGVDLSVLHPQQPEAALDAGPTPPALSSNAHSCVLRIVADSGATALLAGDIEKAQERALLERGAALAADVLLVPHHGSKTSSSGAFLDAVQPRVALVQAAYRSRFGHPAPEVLQRYQERGIGVVDSARCGAATWRSVQPDRVLCERALRPRYWQHRVP